jgi:hypothetical protein
LCIEPTTRPIAKRKEINLAVNNIIGLDFDSVLESAISRFHRIGDYSGYKTYLTDSARLTRWMYTSNEWPIGKKCYQLTCEKEMFIRKDGTFDTFVTYTCGSSLEEVSSYSKKYLNEIRTVAPFLLYSPHENHVIACRAFHEGPVPKWEFDNLGIFKNESYMIQSYIDQGYIIFDRGIVSHSDDQLLTMFHKHN